jgi:nitrate reductase (NAD(P)H)
VPQVTREEASNWTVEISGLVNRPCTLTLADLVDPRKFQTVTLPVTLVCAGNRRKEQNVVKKSLGFSWGPAGLSTALFTGVYLADVLEYVQPRAEGVTGQPDYRRPEHVVFEGAEDLPNGKYGTSQHYRWARNKEKGMLLAWVMNGEALEPDHGFPLRLVVPGQIGGRSVKWLKKIEVSDKESQHHLHFWDNKVLPATLSAEQARNERDWWYDPKYIINDLNVNLAAARPAHDEKLVCSPEVEPTYTAEGYVYAGGGRRVTRVEVSLDDGATWSLADISYPEDRYRTMPFQGRVWGTLDLTERDECFCWAFWAIKIPLDRLKDSACISVRAMDESLHQMPSTMYWNPTGMMKCASLRKPVSSRG